MELHLYMMPFSVSITRCVNCIQWYSDVPSMNTSYYYKKNVHIKYTDCYYIEYLFLQIVDLLLKYGADPLSKSDRGMTPMDMTTERSMYILVEKYLQKTKSNPGLNLLTYTKQI